MKRSMEFSQLGKRLIAVLLCGYSFYVLQSILVETLTGSAESLSESAVRIDDSRKLLQGGSTPDKGPIVIAEGGAQYLYPEMTMRAYVAAIESGADYVTCMLAMTKDGKAICHPTMDLSMWTNIRNNSKLASQKSNFAEMPILHSSDFTLAEIHELRVFQTKPTNRTAAFNGAIRAATPEEVIDKINKRNRDSYNKRVGIALEINENSTGSLPPDLDPVKYAIKLLQKQRWTTPDAPAIVISKAESVLESFVRAGVTVRRLLRVPHVGSGTEGGENATEKAILTGTFSSSSATGVMLHVDSILRETNMTFWGKSLPVVQWDWQMAGRAANGPSLPIYVWGFTESTWSATGPHYNTFQFDQLAFYRSLLRQSNQSVAGIATDWPGTAAKAISCYEAPYKLFGADNRSVQGRPLIISSGGSVGLMLEHMNISFLQAIKDGADYIDCSLGVSKDGVLFCLDGILLQDNTDIASRITFNQTRKEERLFTSANKRTSGWWTFDFNWTEIQTLRVSPQSKDMSARPTLFYGSHPPLSFAEFISIAQNATRPVGIYVKIDYPSYLSGMGREGSNLNVKIDQIKLLMATLRARGYLGADNKYDPAKGMGLIVGSMDSCGLRTMHELSQGTMVLVQRLSGTVPDSCEIIRDVPQSPLSFWLQDSGMSAMKLYASGIGPTRRPFMSASDDDVRQYGVLDPSSINEIGENARKHKLAVYVRAFKNDQFLGDSNSLFAFNYQRDPTIEIEYYVNHARVTAFETKFVSTLTGFLESSCLPRENFEATFPGFKVYGFDPAALHDEIQEVWNPTSEDKDGGGLGIGIILGIVGSTLALAVVVLVLTCVALGKKQKQKKKKKAGMDFQNSINSLVHIPTIKLYTLSELIAATNNFSHERRLGKGGFGAVYKGVATDGTVMAVKKLHMDLKPNEELSENESVRQLLNEVDIIATVHNRNVVTLLGVCMDKELLLVYEYMPNGSLQDAIFDPEYPMVLGWKQWYDIAVGTARGLAYLHEKCAQKIIHRDIKPANILLDAELNPRLADFGLARNVDVQETHVTTKVIGSLGFVAPDYANTGQLTERSDTYSFGVLLLTMITRRQPIGFGEHPEDDSLILEWVKRKAQKGREELLSVIHPYFKDTYEEDQATRWLYTALLCIQDDPGLRPAMGDVVLMLLGKRDVPQITITPVAVTFVDYKRMMKSKGTGNSEGQESYEDSNSTTIFKSNTSSGTQSSSSQ